MGRTSTVCADIGIPPKEVVMTALAAFGSTSQASTETMSAGPKTLPS